MTFGYLWTLLAVCVEQLIMGHAYDEYLVWHKNRVRQRGVILIFDKQIAMFILWFALLCSCSPICLSNLLSLLNPLGCISRLVYLYSIPCIRPYMQS
jgi:hypothetical protein